MAETKMTPEMLEELKQAFKREIALGNYFGEVIEAEVAAGAKRPSPALWAALKCWKEAFQLTRLMGLATPEERDELTLHLAQRPAAPKAG